MKKLMISLALVGMATLAFGQSLVLSGKLNSGVTVISNGVDAAHAALWGEDAGVLGGRLTLNGKVTDGDFGLSFETRWDGLLTSATAGAAAPLYFKHAYVSGSFFDKMVTTQIGIVKEESTRSGGDKGYKFATEVPGAVVVVKPLKDLAIQAFVGAGNAQSAAASNAIGDIVDTITALSAAYTLPNLVKATGGVKYYQSAKNGYVPSEFYAGASLLAVPNLAFHLEYGMATLNTGKLAGVTTIAETASYGFKDLGVAALTVGLKAYQYLYDTDVLTFSNSTGLQKEAQGLSMRIQPWATYALDGGITPKLEVAYVTGASVVAGDYDKYLGAGVAANTDVKKKNANNHALFEVRPSVKLTLTKNQSLNFIYAFTSSLGADEVYFDNSKAAKSLQNIQIDYVCAF